MKKTYFFVLLGFVYCICFAGKILFTSAPPSASTGSLGDGSSCTSCHASGSTSGKSVNISHNIPGTGYLPNTTYQITITGNRNDGLSKYGFQATVENTSGAKRGTLAVSNASETQLNNTNWINHTSTGTAGSTSQKAWTFNWTAPAIGSGTLKIYAIVNFANSNGSSSGDVIVLNNVSITENAVLPIADVQATLKSVNSDIDLTFSGDYLKDQDLIVLETFQEEQWINLSTFAGNKLIKYTHSAPLLGDNYYRLKLQKENNQSYSDVYQIKHLTSINYFYNAVDRILSLDASLKGNTLELYTLNGQLVYQELTQTQQIIPNDLKGVYILRIAGIKKKIVL